MKVEFSSPFRLEAHCLLDSMQKTQVNIITGFLGSGKTTAIIDLLRQNQSCEPWAVIINDFGKISIDSQTVDSATENQSIFDISGGCICCSAKAFFQQDLEKIIALNKFNRILIEPSGLGGIDMVSELVASNSQLMLMPVICMVDISLLYDERLRMNFLYNNQINKSDYIAFSRIDTLLDSKELQELVRRFEQVFPAKTIITKQEMFVVITKAIPTEKRKDNQYRFLQSQVRMDTDSDYRRKTLIFEPEKKFDTQKLAQILKSLPELIRVKGYINTQNSCMLLNYTLSGCSFEKQEAVANNEIVLIAEKVDAFFFEQIESEIKNTIV